MATTANAFSAWRYAKCRDDAGTEHPLLTSPTWWLSGFEPGRVVRIVRLQVRHRCESAVRDSEEILFPEVLDVVDRQQRQSVDLTVVGAAYRACGLRRVGAAAAATDEDKGLQIQGRPAATTLSKRAT